MIGRKVQSKWQRIQGVVIKWEPLGAALCDVLVQRDEGGPIWVASSELEPMDNLGPLPLREEVRKLNDDVTLYRLREIRDGLAKEYAPWPGAEFGKVILGRALNEAIKEISNE